MLNKHHHEDIAYGCIFCKTGYERMLVQKLSESVRSVDFLIAQKKSRRRINGQMTEETVIMFPGYVFFRSHESLDPTPIKKMPSVLKLLTNGDDEWKLAGEDYQFAKWLFSQGGVIGFSKALVVDDRLKILGGPLMGREGQIIKVNRRFQTCLVCMRFGGREVWIWMGYVLLVKDT